MIRLWALWRFIATFFAMRKIRLFVVVDRDRFLVGAVSTIWRATSGGGQRIVPISVTMTRRRTAPLGSAVIAVAVKSAALSKGRARMSVVMTVALLGATDLNIAALLNLRHVPCPNIDSILL